MMVKLGIMTYTVEGLEKLQNSQQELVDCQSSDTD